MEEGALKDACKVQSRLPNHVAILCHAAVGSDLAPGPAFCKGLVSKPGPGGPGARSERRGAR